ATRGVPIGPRTYNPAPMSESQPSAVRDSQPHIVACSEFVAAALSRQPDLVDVLVAEGYLDAPRVPGSFVAALRAAAATVVEETQMMALLRRWRRRELVRIAWRDLAGASSVEESLRDLTELADAAIGCA